MVRQFVNTNIAFADAILVSRYADSGRPATRLPSDLIRSMMLAARMGFNSITDWVAELRTNPFAAIVSGFEPDDVPGVGTFYDFIKRIWSSEDANLSSAVRPKKERPPKPARKGEKAPSIEKHPVENVIRAFEEQPSEELQDLAVLWAIFLGFLARSQDEGLINIRNLVLAGDGSPIRTAAQERSKPFCDCRERGIFDCKCPRFFSQPDCDWGFDSHRNAFFFGYHMYLFTDPSSKHDLPIFPFLGPASRHDSHGFVHTWFAAKALLPDFHAATVLLDSAHDALAIYNLLVKEGTQYFIDLNKGNSTPQEQKDWSVGPDGVPVCSQGHVMKHAGFDKAQHRIKYRCPKMCMRDGQPVCECDSPCTPAKYGRQVHVYPDDNPRLFCTPPRGTEDWKSAYNARTGAERANKRIKIDYRYEQRRHRSTRAWYFSLFMIMMCMHQEAWSIPDSCLGEKEDLSEAA